MRTILFTLLFFYSFQWTYGQTKTPKSSPKSSVKKTQTVIKKPVVNKQKPVEVVPEKTQLRVLDEVWAGYQHLRDGV